tara:strand:+ start:90 stop:515 length:426 start_codon:yes stop_codon:yes gene_type:complete
MFTHPEIWAFATNWYLLLDIHAPLESFKPLLTNDVDLVFPEANLKGFEGYSSWYNKVIEIFFDEQHTLKVADIIDQNENSCKLHVIVNWHASMWNPPLAKSTKLMMDADQTWNVVRNADQTLSVSKYVVNEMIYEDGSCKL